MKTLSVRAAMSRGDFSLNIEVAIKTEGVTAIFGKSGAGKSSLLRVIAGLDRVPGGRVKFGDRTWQDEDNQIWVPAHRRNIGYVFQHPGLFEHLDVAGNLDYAQKRARKRARGAELSPGNLSQFGIDHLLDRKVSGLSGGEKQRVAIARALASNPEVLLMDEPVTALDSSGKEEILGLIQNVHKTIKIPVIYVSHSLDEVARLSSRILLVREGCVAAYGATVDMLLHPEIALETANRLETIIDAEVTALDDRYGLCRLAFSGGNLWVINHGCGLDGYSLGDGVRARVMARDLSLTLERQVDTSIQNIVAAQIVDIREPAGAQVIVELDAGGCRLLAQVTKRSRDRLKLVEGKAVYAQIKSVALLS